ncbi:MAG: N-acetylmuramic acid 6-phosphate etherase [bacterium]
MSKQVFDEIEGLITETRNPRSMEIDAKDTREILQIINEEDQSIPAVVAQEIPYIAAAVDLIVDGFKKGGKLFYIGAGTSGRLGVLDASECPPTYGTAPEMIQGLIAGGYKALVRSQEGAEDDAEQGPIDLQEAGFSSQDIAFGIAASRRTPYVLSALQYANAIGAKTIYLICNPRAELTLSVNVSICPVVGPEVIMGSTRMKAGTATKLVLNMITTAAMIKLGKVYGNLMVDLRLTSEKTAERSKRVVMMMTGLNYQASEELINRANGHVKTALVMALANVPAEEARAKLQKADGFIRRAIEKV